MSFSVRRIFVLPLPGYQRPVPSVALLARSLDKINSTPSGPIQ